MDTFLLIKSWYAEIPKSERIFRIKRIFRIIRLLRERKKTVKQPAQILSTSIHNIYRDIDDIKGFGYMGFCDTDSRYGLEENPSGENTRKICRYTNTHHLCPQRLES
jgi:hypothetical protein